MAKKAKAKTYAEKEALFRKTYGHLGFKDPDAPRSRPDPFAPPRDLPWENSYANWCDHLRVGAAKHNAKITYGANTYSAWQAGIPPFEYAKIKGTR